MHVMFINNDGGSHPRREPIAHGTSPRQFLSQVVPGASLENYTVRVNRAETDLDNTVLVDGDRVTLSPKKVAGA